MGMAMGQQMANAFGRSQGQQDQSGQAAQQVQGGGPGRPASSRRHRPAHPRSLGRTPSGTSASTGGRRDPLTTIALAEQARAGALTPTDARVEGRDERLDRREGRPRGRRRARRRPAAAAAGLTLPADLRRPDPPPATAHRDRPADPGTSPGAIEMSEPVSGPAPSDPDAAAAAPTAAPAGRPGR